MAFKKWTKYDLIKKGLIKDDPKCLPIVKNYTYEIPSPPTYFMIGKRKIYTTAQAFYSGTNHYQRSNMVKQSKAFLLAHIHKINIKHPVSINCVFSTKNKPRFDIDNKGYYWGKMINDLFKDIGVLLEDNTNNVQGVKYSYNPNDKRDNLTVYISSLNVSN